MADENGRFGAPFACAPGMRLEAHERLSALQIARLTEEIERVEELIDRIEKRLWLAVYGVVALILGQAVQSLIQLGP
jgi:hypothetical protein